MHLMSKTAKSACYALLLAIVFMFAVSSSSSSSNVLYVMGDVYMHNPRGSNNRNCRTDDNNGNRQNANRLFNSENNDAGGYSCPRAPPFNCAKYAAGSAERDTCNGNVGSAGRDGITNDDVDAVVTPQMYFYEGSVLPIEWTNQHGCGDNPRVHCDVIIQYACEDTLTDDCGESGSDKECGPRDGVPIRNEGGDKNLDRQATDTIEDNAGSASQQDYRYGRHETYRYYQRCQNRERNKGLFIADQNINKDDARGTRQNPNGDRYGFECPEEHDYYPYWHDSPWKDIAVLTDQTDKCGWYRSESQNVKAKHECKCPNGPGSCEGNSDPNNERDCLENDAGAEWVAFPAHNISKPDCKTAPTTRENHLGHPIGNKGYMGSVYNWTIPSLRRSSDGTTVGEYCVLRIRYNITSTDYDGHTLNADSTSEQLIYDRENNEEKAYVGFEDLEDDSEISAGARLGLAVNTNQYGRTFQDRSYTFSIKPRPSGACSGTIYNMNVRGKRGNIVQAYPAVEYDFVPSYLHITDNDCVHVQWTGSDFNPDREPNNGFGGPSSPTNADKFKADRHNMVQVVREGDSHPIKRLADTNMFKFGGGRDSTNATTLAFINQPIWDRTKCKTIAELQGVESDQDRRDALYENCGKLSGAATPYFDAGILKPRQGSFTFMSTRDHSLSNRDMKGTLEVSNHFLQSAAFKALVSIGVLLVLGGIAFLVVKQRRRSGKPLFGSGNSSGNDSYFRRNSPVVKGGNSASSPSSSTGAAGAAAGGGVLAAGVSSIKAKAAGGKNGKKTVVTALYTHTPEEAGELGFKKGAKVVVLKKDNSGWWEGEHNGERGIFPSNYVQE